MNDDIPLPFELPAVARKKVSAAFDGGRITSDGGVMLLAQAEQRLGIAKRLAAVIPDARDADHSSAAGYPAARSVAPLASADEAGVDELLGLLPPSLAELMRAYPVETRVGNVRNNDPAFVLLMKRAATRWRSWPCYTVSRFAERSACSYSR